MINVDDKEYDCPVDIFIDIFNDRFKLYIVWHLQDSPKRFKELTKILSSTTQKTLTLKLKELERRHIINREVFPEVPLRVEYSLTPIGEKLKPILQNLHDWGDVYGKEFNSNYPEVCKD